MIELTVKTLDSRNHSFSVADEFTVKQLKEHIAEAVGIAAESQRLIYCGRVLQDEKNLSEYDVNGKVIHLVQRAPPSSNGSGGGGGGSGIPNTTTGQRRPWRNTSNHVYVGAMAFPAEIMDASGIAMQQPRPCLSHSRLTVARLMLRRAEALLSRLENPSAESSPDSANGSGAPERSVEDDITNGNNPIASVEISTDAFDLRTQDPEVGSSEPQQEEARAPESTLPESEQPPPTRSEGGEEGTSGRQRRYPHPPVLAELMDRVADVNNRLAPFMAQYHTLMRDDPVMNDEAAVTSNQRLFSSVSEIMHNMSHAYHALSDIMCDFSQPPPRSLRCRPVLIHHSAVVHTGIPIQVSANLGGMPANQAGNNSDTANSNGRPSENSSAVGAGANAPSAPPPPPPPTSAANQPRTTPPVAHVAPRMGPISGGGPGFEFLVDMTPGSITIDSVEATVVSNSPQNSSENPQNNWQNPPEFVQNLISALAGQFMGATLQQFQLPSQQNVGTNTQSTQQNTGTNTQTTGSTQTQTTAAATQSTGTSTQSNGVSTQNTGTSMQNSGVTTQNTGTNTQNTGANVNSRQPTANSGAGGGNGGAAGQASAPNGGSQPRGNGRPHVHLPPLGMIQNHFDPFLPCNSHHIRGGRSRGGRPANGSGGQAASGQAAAAPPPPPPRSTAMAMPIPSSISISLRADPVISVEAHPVRSSGAATGNQEGVPLPFPPELQAFLQALRPPDVASDPAAGLPQHIANFMQALQGSQGSQSPPTIAQMVLNVPGYTYVAGESIVLDICMTLAQSLTMLDVIQLGLGQSACLGRARPQLRQLISRLSGQPPPLVERLNAELRTHYSIFDNVRLREDVDLPASISRYNQTVLPGIINIIMDENQSITTFHRVLMRKCALYVHQLCALLQYCCIDASGFESLLRACVNRVTSGIPAALQEWTTISSMQNLRSFISSVSTPASEIQQYVVFRATSPQPATAPAPAPVPATAPAAQPASEPMDTHEAEEVPSLNTATALNAAVPPVADDAPSLRVNDVIGWQSALPSEWVPIITRDSQRQRRQSTQGPFSDAYLSGMPSKRRKLISSAKPQGNLSQVISENMATALGAAGMSSGPEVEAVVQRAGQDSSLQAAYREQVRSTLSRNLDVNPDFTPDKYPNTAKYFDKK